MTHGYDVCLHVSVCMFIFKFKNVNMVMLLSKYTGKYQLCKI